jgi:hypothetical protein
VALVALLVLVVAQAVAVAPQALDLLQVVQAEQVVLAAVAVVETEWVLPLVLLVQAVLDVFLFTTKILENNK